MSHVLTVSAFQFSNPFAPLVLMKTDDLARHLTLVIVMADHREPQVRSYDHDHDKHN
jgi:hypothetical protein